MSRLLALSLLALAAPCAAAEQVHPCQAETPPCSPAMAQARLYLDELDRNAGNFVAPPAAPPAISSELAQTLREEEKASRHLDEADRELAQARRELAQALRDKEKASRYLNDLWRETGPGTPAWDRAPAPPKPRHHVPYPLSRELLTGAVNPCAGSRPACPWELKEIYGGLKRNRDDKDSWHYKHYLHQLEDYYRDYRP